MQAFKRVLVLAPHTDDGEFGCGGAIARMIENKTDVFYVAFSSADKSVPAHLPSDTLKKEVVAATKELSIKESNLILFDYGVRNFSTHRQMILEEMVRLNKELAPDAVFLPSIRDTHQDHQVIAQEGFRAFKKRTMLAYEVPWNNLSFYTTGFVPLEKKHVEKKIKALSCYESQKERRYADPEYIWSLARTRGVQVDVDFAEVFEVIRWLID